MSAFCSLVHFCSTVRGAVSHTYLCAYIHELHRYAGSQNARRLFRCMCVCVEPDGADAGLIRCSMEMPTASRSTLLSTLYLGVVFVIPCIIFMLLDIFMLPGARSMLPCTVFVFILMSVMCTNFPVSISTRPRCIDMRAATSDISSGCNKFPVAVAVTESSSLERD